ncbi:unnamed protein product [Cuscuta europaea]|uniref:Uncharacterized protein n=1 Tax=Cuscuta europaea TaxID=41803 RepID=A0A9P0YPC4_CUSEU|nr:unnamed protein product [Cuscuta europaea]
MRFCQQKREREDLTFMWIFFSSFSFIMWKDKKDFNQLNTKDQPLYLSKHSFNDLSCVCPTVFVYLLKECYAHGTCKGKKLLLFFLFRAHLWPLEVNNLHPTRTRQIEVDSDPEIEALFRESQTSADAKKGENTTQAGTSSTRSLAGKKGAETRKKNKLYKEEAEIRKRKA